MPPQKKEVERVLAEVDVTQWEERVRWHEFASEQRADPLLKQRIEFMEHGIMPQNADLLRQFMMEKPRYAMRDGVLMHIAKWGKSAEPTIQAVVPRHMRLEILQQCHGDVFAAHFGVGKTFSKLSARYFWDGYFNDTEHFVQQCDLCARYKTSRKTKAPLMPMPFAGPWERVGVDLVGPLPVTGKGSRFIIVFTDYFSRWVEAVPLPNAEAATCAEAFLREIVCRFGAPRELLSDRGAQFLSKIMLEVCKMCDIKKKNTVAYHPACNGLTEKCNAVIGTMLAIYVAKYQKQWDEWIPYILFAYRSTVQVSLKNSPYKVLFGREPTIPGELVAHPSERKKPSDYVDNVADRLAAMKEIVKKNLLEAQSRQKAYYDKTTRVPSDAYEVQHLVWRQLERQGVGAKLKPKYGGPYIIIARPTPVDAVIRLWKDSSAKPFMEHFNRLKPCFAPWQLPPGEDEDDDDDIEGEDSTAQSGTPGMARNSNPLEQTREISVPRPEMQMQPHEMRETVPETRTEERNSNFQGARERNLSPTESQTPPGSPPSPERRIVHPISAQPTILTTQKTIDIPKAGSNERTGKEEQGPKSETYQRPSFSQARVEGRYGLRRNPTPTSRFDGP